MQTATLFIGADPQTHAGEADYVQALALAAKPAGVWLAARLGGAVADGAAPIATGRDAYARLPAPDHLAASLASFSRINIVACGASTLAAAQALQSELGAKAHLHAVLHMLPEDPSALTLPRTTVYAPVSDAPANIHLVTLPAVPHTNTQAACARELAVFAQQLQAGDFIKATQDAGFACAVVNAGFADAAGMHHPYTQDEAAAHGALLGQRLEGGTHLLLMHGGPRNLKDEGAGHATMAHFAKGYLRAQFAQGAAPRILRERFAPDLPYNAIKAAYALAARKTCRAFVSNAEGYGTLDGALKLLPPALPLGIFPFKAEDSDVTGQRQAHRAAYVAQGVALFDRPADPAGKPAAPRASSMAQDPAALIVARLTAAPRRTPGRTIA